MYSLAYFKYILAEDFKLKKYKYILKNLKIGSEFYSETAEKCVEKERRIDFIYK